VNRAAEGGPGAQTGPASPPVSSAAPDESGDAATRALLPGDRLPVEPRRPAGVRL